MTSIRFRSSNVADFSNGAPAYLIGKNGFSTELGVIPVLVTDSSKIDLDSNIKFTIRGLSSIIDENTGDHVVVSEANDIYNFQRENLPKGAKLTRASTASYVNNSILLGNAAVNAFRISYDPVTGEREGLLVEANSTNFVRNSTMVGAVPGSAGTVPTGWTVTSTANGLTRHIALSTEDGMSCIDIRYVGTPTSTHTKSIGVEGGAFFIPASVGQTWNFSHYVRVSAGSTANVTLTPRLTQRNSGGSALLILSGPDFVPTSNSIITQRRSNTLITTSATVAYLNPDILLSATLNNPVDITLRIAMPQVELLSQSSPIPTSTSNVVRQADVATITVPNGTYSVVVRRTNGNTLYPAEVVTGNKYRIPTSSYAVERVTVNSKPYGANHPGSKQFTYKVAPNESDEVYGDIAYVDPYIPASADIIDYDLDDEYIKIDNPITDGLDLYSRLQNPPFYGSLHQVLAVNSFSAKSMYVSGTTLKYLKTYNVFNYSGSYTADLEVRIEDKNFVDVYLDGTPVSSTQFEWDDRANITVSLSNSATELRIIYSTYTYPTIERGDNIAVTFNNTYSIINASYLLNTSKYNSTLTANSIFRVYPFQNLRFNSTGFIATNISPDPFGTVGNVDTTNNTFTFDYNDATFPGNFQLANNKVYKLLSGTAFSPLLLTEGRTVYDVDPGLITVRARNINPAGRKSPYTTQTVEIGDVVLPAVENIIVTESLYYDTTQGVATRAVISFDHNPKKEILSYELSYKLETEDGISTDFITVQIPITAVDNQGRLNYIINNVDRGRTSGVNLLVIRITPINNSITGVTKQIIHTIIGKTAPPYNVTSFFYAQNSNILTLYWTFALNSDNSIKDLDLQEVEIRRVQGILTTADQFLTAWNGAQFIATIGIPTTNKNLSIDAYGYYTYLIKTRDTSKNESTDVIGISLLLQRPTNLSAYKTWSEDEPAANNSVAFMANENYREYFWPSFANSDNGGLYYAVDDPITAGVGPSTLTENANGTSSGYSVTLSSNDLLASANAMYQTSIRDAGTIITGRISTDINVYSILASTWLSMRENLVSGVSDVSPSANVLWDNGSYIGQVLTSNSAIYNTVNKTLSSGGTYGNIYAIWNSGQFNGDTSNANSFTLIAGVINANALALGATYYAGAVSSSSNLLPNLTTSSGSYQLVNLKQWGDPEGLGNWQGPDGLVSYNLELRYSSVSPYFSGSNANVNVMSFSSSNTGVFATYQSGEIEFRWFQIRTWINNRNPQLASTILDKMRYTLDLANKTFTTTVNVISNPTFVDYSAQGFRSTPNLSLTPIIDSPLRINNTFPSYSSIGSNSKQANITVYSNTGTFVSGTLVTVTATGF